MNRLCESIVLKFCGSEYDSEWSPPARWAVLDDFFEAEPSALRPRDTPRVPISQTVPACAARAELYACRMLLRWSLRARGPWTSTAESSSAAALQLLLAALALSR
eukprot:4195255-Amphidinium_carterae.2